MGKKCYLLLAAVMTASLLSGCVIVTARDDALVETVRDWKIRSDRGEARAQYNLGWYGFNSALSLEEEKAAFDLFAQAAEQGLPEAQFAIATLYDRGRGGERDSEKAIHWYRQAAEGGLAEAQYNLGATYAQGTDIAKNDKKAFKWFFLAALQEDTEARRALRVLSKRMPAEDRIVARKEAQRFLKDFKSRELGNAKAKNRDS